MVGFIEVAVELGFTGWVDIQTWGGWFWGVEASRGIILSQQSQGCCIGSVNGYYGWGIWKATFGPRLLHN